MAIGQHVQKYLESKEKLVAAVAQEEAEREVYEQADITPPEPSMAGVLMMMADLLKEMRGAKTGEEKDAALRQAELLEQILVKTKPENVAPPLISVYSNPRGERDDPKAPLRCEMRWVGYDVKTDTLTPPEVAALNELQPGAYKVTKADGTKIQFTVTAIHNSNLELERMDIWFPCKGEARHNHGTMISYCQQAMGKAIPTAEELYAELQTVKAELARAKAAA